MIDERHIAAWAAEHPWRLNEYVEQDLVICRAMVAIFSDPFLAGRLVWKGGTALHKLFLAPQARYSEDIDLVQLVPGPIKPVFERLHDVLDWLPGRSTEQTRTSNKMKFKYLSEVEPQVPMGRCDIPVFRLPELLGTKFNALYGRKKIRDLFDLDYALRKTDVDVGSMLRCWRSYRENAGEPKVGRSKIVANVEAKLADPDYLADLDNFLAPGVSFDPRSAWDNVKARIVDRI